MPTFNPAFNDDGLWRPEPAGGTSNLSMSCQSSTETLADLWNVNGASVDDRSGVIEPHPMFVDGESMSTQAPPRVSSALPLPTMPLRPTAPKITGAQARAMAKDYRTGCTRDPGVGDCFLGEDERQAMARAMDRNFLYVAQNLHDALQIARVEQLLSKSSGWGFVGELVFNMLSSVLLSGAGTIATTIGGRLAAGLVQDGEIAAERQAASSAAHAAAITGTVKQLTNAAKVKAKQALGGYSHETTMKQQFLKELQNEVGPFFESLAVEIQTQGDDTSLVSATESITPQRLSEAVFETEIDRLIESFSASRLDTLGERPDHRCKTEVVRLQAGQQSRLAIFDFKTSVRMGTSHGETWYSGSGTDFRGWVDDEIADAAQSLQQTNVGPTKTFDVTNGQAFGSPEIAAWVESVVGKTFWGLPMDSNRPALDKDSTTKGSQP